LEKWQMSIQREMFDRDSLPHVGLRTGQKILIGCLQLPEDIRQIQTKFVHSTCGLEQILSHQDSTILLLRGLVLDLFDLATNPYTSSDTERQLRQWFPNWKGNVITDGCRGPDIKIFDLGATIEDFVQRRGHEIPAFARIKNL
jgi:hypothetical protein